MVMRRPGASPTPFCRRRIGISYAGSRMKSNAWAFARLFRAMPENSVVRHTRGRRTLETFSGIGPCGVPRPSLADYVTVMDPRIGRPPSEGARVAYALASDPQLARLSMGIAEQDLCQDRALPRCVEGHSHDPTQDPNDGGDSRTRRGVLDQARPGQLLSAHRSDLHRRGCFEGSGMKCPRCQVENDAGARFCEDCGARLEAACPSCGAVVCLA
jgi:hypothetical protein